MAEKRVIAVMGATGSQGGGLARAILSDPSGGFAARAITRNPQSDKAKELAGMGAEVVAGDVDDEASLEKAFAGAWGVYCVTFFWEHMSADREKGHAQSLARAAKKAGPKHVIWSSLEDTRRLLPIEDKRMPVLQGKYNVPHLDAKGECDPLFQDLGVTTVLRTSFYWDNLVMFDMGPKKGPDGVLAFTLPMGDRKLPGMAAEDIGKCAYGIFKRSGEFVGKTVGIAGQHLTGTQMAASLAKAFGQEVRYNAVTPDQYRAFGFPGADEMGNMFQFKADFEKEYCGARDLDLSRSLNPSLQTFDEWLAHNKANISLE